MIELEENIRYITLGNVPIRKKQSDIENYSFLLTDIYPSESAIIESSSYSTWLISFQNNIGLLKNV
jgi:hypothetical protein